MKTSYHQWRALDELNDGGKIFEFEDGSVGLDSVYGDTLKFRKSTFNFLVKNNLITIIERPSLGCMVYGITENGKITL